MVRPATHQLNDPEYKHKDQDKQDRVICDVLTVLAGPDTIEFSGHGKVSWCSGGEELDTHTSMAANDDSFFAHGQTVRINGAANCR